MVISVVEQKKIVRTGIDGVLCTSARMILQKFRLAGQRCKPSSQTGWIFRRAPAHAWQVRSRQVALVAEEENLFSEAWRPQSSAARR
jgi:hypothetical protein